jgi:hypothetical protein
MNGIKKTKKKITRMTNERTTTSATIPRKGLKKSSKMKS